MSQDLQALPGRPAQISMRSWEALLTDCADETRLALQQALHEKSLADVAESPCLDAIIHILDLGMRMNLDPSSATAGALESFGGGGAAHKRVLPVRDQGTAGPDNSSLSILDQGFQDAQAGLPSHAPANAAW